MHLLVEKCSTLVRQLFSRVTKRHQIHFSRPTMWSKSGISDGVIGLCAKCRQRQVQGCLSVGLELTSVTILRHAQ
jgi:hypothetical protein